MSSSHLPSFILATTWSWMERGEAAGGEGGAVAGEEVEGAQRRHRLQGAGPVQGVALHLVRVAGVGGGPDERVAGAEDAAAGAPDPGLVVRLAAGGGQLENLAPAGDDQAA